MYMLYDLNPPPKFDFNPEKMSTLLSRTEKWIEQKVIMCSLVRLSHGPKTYANIDEINGYLQQYVATPDFIAQHGKVDMTPENVQSLVDTLMYDGTVEDFKAPQEQVQTRF